MILCMNCGKVDTYRLTARTIKRMYFNEAGECVSEEDTGTVYQSDQVPRCPRCGRTVKLFKDDFED